MQSVARSYRCRRTTVNGVHLVGGRVLGASPGSTPGELIIGKVAISISAGSTALYILVPPARARLLASSPKKAKKAKKGTYQV